MTHAEFPCGICHRILLLLHFRLAHLLLPSMQITHSTKFIFQACYMHNEKQMCAHTKHSENKECVIITAHRVSSHWVYTLQTLDLYTRGIGVW